MLYSRYPYLISNRMLIARILVVSQFPLWFRLETALLPSLAMYVYVLILEMESWPLWECTFFHAVITVIMILVII